MSKPLQHAKYLRGLPFYNAYDAGSETLVASTPTTVTPDETLMQLLIYPMIACTIKFNESEKVVHCPAEAYTPITMLVEEFVLESIEAGDVYWTGYYLT